TGATGNKTTNPNAAALVSQVNKVLTGNRSPSSWLKPAMAKPITTTSANTDCSIDPFLGAPLCEVFPSAAGRTVARPRAKKYRAVALWKANSTANRLVTNSRLAKWLRAGERCANQLKIRSGPYTWDSSMMLLGPTPTVIAQAEKA